MLGRGGRKGGSRRKRASVHSLMHSGQREAGSPDSQMAVGSELAVVEVYNPAEGWEVI